MLWWDERGHFDLTHLVCQKVVGWQVKSVWKLRVKLVVNILKIVALIRHFNLEDLVLRLKNFFFFLAHLLVLILLFIELGLLVLNIRLWEWLHVTNKLSLISLVNLVQTNNILFKLLLKLVQVYFILRFWELLRWRFLSLDLVLVIYGLRLIQVLIKSSSLGAHELLQVL